MKTFEVKEDFYLDGKKVKIISGGMNYFRTVPEYWRDRLEKLKALGCNTVETYIPATGRNVLLHWDRVMYSERFRYH